MVSGVRLVVVRFLSVGNGRVFSFVGGNGTSKYVIGISRNGFIGFFSLSNSNNNLNFDGKGTIYLLFNVGDIIFISDLNS